MNENTKKIIIELLQKRRKHADQKYEEGKEGQSVCREYWYMAYDLSMQSAINCIADHEPDQLCITKHVFRELADEDLAAIENTFEEFPEWNLYTAWYAAELYAYRLLSDRKFLDQQCIIWGIPNEVQA